MKCYRIIKMHDLGISLSILIWAILIHHRILRNTIMFKVGCLWYFFSIFTHMKTIALHVFFKNLLPWRLFITVGEKKIFNSLLAC